MLEYSFSGCKSSSCTWYTYRELVPDVEKTAVLRNKVVKVVSASRIAEIGKGKRLGSVLFLLCFSTN